MPSVRQPSSSVKARRPKVSSRLLGRQRARIDSRAVTVKRQRYPKTAPGGEGPVTAQRIAAFQWAVNYVDEWTLRLIEEVRAGKPSSEPVPHPDDFAFDFGKLEFTVDGPMPRRQKLYQDALIADLPELLQNLPKLEELLAATAALSVCRGCPSPECAE
jgi:hypothetical protein